MKSCFAFALFVPLPFFLSGAIPESLALEIMDADTGKNIPCLLRITDEKKGVLKIEGLYNRGTGLRRGHPASQWYCHDGQSEIKGIFGNLKIEAFAGPEYEMVSVTEQITAGQRIHRKLTVNRIKSPGKNGWRSGNTHLHLMKLSREQADFYLQTVPRSDGLELVFVSNLRRANAEKEYITNNHRPADLMKLNTKALKFGWGEEHRHNYGPGGQGYGHVMLLNIKKLVHPVSIGSGIMLEGTDDPPLQKGLRQARGEGATVVWCHNSFGLEDIPNWFSGTVDAQNIFDGGSHDSYEKTFYRYLNVGLRVPFSTGTDWFIYDFSRVYVKMEGELMPERWLSALRKGRSYITNGPLMELRCGKYDIGDIIAIDNPQKLVFRGTACGRNDFRKLQMVYNGKVVAETSSRHFRAKAKIDSSGYHKAVLNWTLNADQPGWVALRVNSGFTTIPITAPVVQKGKGVNEFGQGLFGHTSPMYIDYTGKRVFQHRIAKALKNEMESSIDEILERSKFFGDVGKMQVLRVYEKGIKALERRLEAKK